MMSNYRFEDDDRKEFAKVLAVLGQAYDKAITPELAKAYELALADLPIRSIKRKAHQHLKSSRWFPRPSELRCRGAEYRQKLVEKHQASITQRRQDDVRRLYWTHNPPLALTHEVEE